MKIEIEKFKSLAMNALGHILPSGVETEAIIGIDIGQADIKLVHFVKLLTTNSWILARHEKKPLDKVSDEREKNKQISSIIRSFIANNDIKKTRVVCVISDLNSVEKILRTPLMSRAELEKAIFWKMKDFLHFPLEEANINFKIIGKIDIEGETRDEIFSLAFPKKTISNFVNLFKMNNIIPYSFVGFVTCIEHSLTALDVAKDETIAFVDLGASHSDLAIFKNKKFVFSRHLPVSGSSINKALTSVLEATTGKVSLTFEQAEEVKKSCGIPPATSEQIEAKFITCNQILSLMRPEIEKLGSEIEHSFDYYREELGASNIDRLVLAGGGANLKNLDLFLNQQLGIPVQVINPFKDVVVKQDSVLADKDKVQQEFDPGLFLCIGAARSIIDELATKTIEINSLPAEIRQQNKLFIRKLTLEIILTISILIGAFFLVGTKLAILGMEKRIQAIDAQIYASGYKLKEASMKGVISQIYSHEPRWLEVFKEISNIIPDNTYLERLTYDNDELLLEGVIISKADTSEATLSGLMLALEKGIFKNVSLIESKKLKEEGLLMRTEFKLKCQVE